MLEKVTPKVVMDDSGMFAHHNMPCAVCWDEPAVLQMNEGHFLPCWKCQNEGWNLTKKRKWKKRA